MFVFDQKASLLEKASTEESAADGLHLKDDIEIRNVSVADDKVEGSNDLNVKIRLL